jgi:hypothetical protein
MKKPGVEVGLFVARIDAFESRFGGPISNQHHPLMRTESRLRESAQGDKWSFCLTAGKIGPRIRREHEQETAPEPCIGL